MYISKSTNLTVVGMSVLFLAGIMACPGHAEIEPAAIMGAWLFDEGGGDTAQDSSESKNDGRVFGAEWVDGKFDKALEFDGIDDYVETSFQAIEAGEGTIAAWIKPYRSASSQLIVYTGQGLGDGWGGEEEFHVGLRDLLGAAFSSTPGVAMLT